MSRRYHLKEKEAKALLSDVSQKLKADIKSMLGGKADVEVLEAGFAEIYLINGKPVLARAEGRVFPVLVFEEFLAVAPRVVVDMGAVSHVCNGANVMAPGVRRFVGEFGVGDFVVVVDEKHGKSLAIGEVAYDSGEAKNVKQGVVVRSVHFVGDRIWNFIKGLGSGG